METATQQCDEKSYTYLYYSGKDLWTYVQQMPHLFSVGGLFFQQVERDLGLTDGKHCTLPALPGKVIGQAIMKRDCCIMLSCG